MDMYADADDAYPTLVAATVSRFVLPRAQPTFVHMRVFGNLRHHHSNPHSRFDDYGPARIGGVYH